MKYVVITSKHQDGFALKFCLYYSHAQDWTHPGGAIAGIKTNQPGWDPAQTGDFANNIKTIAVPQTQEILTRYKPDILWWDTPTNMTPELAKPLHDLLAQVPGIISNDRLGGGYKGDTKTPEQHIPPCGYPGQMFEVCMTINDTWGFKKNDHNGLLWNSHLLANNYQDAGRMEEALKRREEALAMARKINGPDEPFTLRLMNKLAELHEKTCRKDEAAKLRAELEALKAKQ